LWAGLFPGLRHADELTSEALRPRAGQPTSDEDTAGA